MNINYKNQLHQRFLSSLAACVVALAFSLPASADEPKPDEELLLLEKALENAGPQSELNIASKNIADYWDRKLAKVELVVALTLTAEEKVKFEASKKQFREFRDKQVELKTAKYDGGSIRALMANSEHSSITEKKVRELEKLLEIPQQPESKKP